MHNPVNVGQNTAEWCSHVVAAFEGLQFSVPVEFWMLDWKNEIRIKFPEWQANVEQTFGEELAAQLPEHTVTKTLIGWQLGYLPREHALANWGIVL